MKLSEELKRRIKQLEQEQDRQEEEIQELNELRDLAAISELENELKQVESKSANPSPGNLSKIKDADLDKERELAELAERARRELRERQRRLQAEEARKAQEYVTPPTEFLAEFEEEVKPKAKSPKIRGGYAVCLMFNPASPSEWSEEAGGGWRGKGLGTHYSDLDEAKSRLAALKDKWPDYPLKIIKL